MKKGFKLKWRSRTGKITPIEKLEHAHALHIVIMLSEKAKDFKWVKKSIIFIAVKKRLNECEGKKLV